MSHNRYVSLNDYMDNLSDDHRLVIESLRSIFLEIEGVNESIRRDCLHFKYPNGMRVYINTKSQKYPVLGVSRGAKMIKMYPMLVGMFDEVMKVVGKIILPDVNSIESKGITALADLCTQMPNKLGVL